MAKQNIWNEEKGEFELKEVDSVFGCDPDQYVPGELKHSHIYPDPRIEDNNMESPYNVVQVSSLYIVQYYKVGIFYTQQEEVAENLAGLLNTAHQLGYNEGLKSVLTKEKHNG